MAEEQWYYSSQGRQLGPVTREMLRSMIVTAQVRETDMVWTAGMGQWAAAQMVPQLMTAETPTQQGMLATARAIDSAYAGFWRRLLAWAIDTIVLAVLSLILATVILTLLGEANANLTPEQLVRRPTFLAEGSIIAALLVLHWLYYALMECSSHQGTLGKLVIGIYVAREDGGEVSFFAATVRFIARLISTLLLFIGFLMAAFTLRKQALHDLAAGTVVVRRR